MELTKDQEMNLSTTLEEMDIPADKVREILIELENIEGASEEGAPSGVSDEEIKMEIFRENDWRRRAALKALLISKQL